VDNALKALRAKRGTPCQECLQRIIDVLQQGINNKEKEG
jgi:DNA-binding XRE family transcriptional regulator